MDTLKELEHVLPGGEEPVAAAAAASDPSPPAATELPGESLPEIATKVDSTIPEIDPESGKPKDVAVSNVDQDFLQKRMRVASDLTKRSISTILTYILACPPALEFLQKRYGIFVTSKTRGFWTVIITVEEAMRLVNETEKILHSRRITDALADDEGKWKILDWKRSVFFVDIEMIQQFEDSKKIVTLTANTPGLEKRAAELHETFFKRYKLLSVMQPDDLRSAVKCMMGYELETQIALSFTCIDPKYSLTGSESYAFDISGIAAEPFIFLRRLMLYYFVAIRDIELTICYELGTNKPLNREVSNLMLDQMLEYSACVMHINGLHDDVDKPIALADMAPSINMPKAPCGLCGVLCVNGIRCRDCKLFRYCSNECADKHRKKVVAEVKNNDPETVVFVTHVHTCQIARALVKLWAQLPDNMSKEDFMYCNAMAQQKFYELMHDPTATTVTEEVVDAPKGKAEISVASD